MQTSRKGYTIIEVSIVLVLIGLIYAAIVKGRDVIQNSNDIKEAAKVKRIIESSLVAIDEFQWKPPVMGVGVGYNFDMYTLSPSPSLDREPRYLDFLIPGWKKKNENVIYTVVPFFEGIQGTPDKSIKYSINSTKQNAYGLSVAPFPTEDDFYGISKMNRRIACIIEKYLDDSSYMTGIGRTIDNWNTFDKRCENLANEYFTYIYKIKKL